MPPTVPGPSTSSTKGWLDWFPMPKTTQKTQEPKSNGRLTPRCYDLSTQSVEQDLNALDRALGACVFQDRDIRGGTLTIVPAIVEIFELTITTLNPDGPLASLERVAPVYKGRLKTSPGTLGTHGAPRPVYAGEPVQPIVPTDLYDLNNQQMEHVTAIEATLAAQAKIIDTLADQNVPIWPSRSVSFATASTEEEPTYQQEIGVREIFVSEVVDIARHAIGELRNAYNRELQLIYMLEGNKRPKAFREYFGFKSTRAPRDTLITTQLPCLETSPQLPTAPVSPEPVRVSSSQNAITAQRSTALEYSAAGDLELQNQDLLRPDGANSEKMFPAERAVYTQIARDNLQMMKDAIHALAQFSQGVKKYDNGQT